MNPSEPQSRARACVCFLATQCLSPGEFSLGLGANASPSRPLLSDFILAHFWSQAFCFLFSTREPESGPQKNKAALPTGNVCSGGEFGGWRQAGQDPCQWNVIWGGSCRSLNCWQPAREQLHALWAVCAHRLSSPHANRALGTGDRSIRKKLDRGLENQGDRRD